MHHFANDLRDVELLNIHLMKYKKIAKVLHGKHQQNKE